MKYKAMGVRKYTKKVEETEPGAQHEAHNAAMEMLRSKRFKVITILRDSEGADHPANAGKFFLDRIIK